MGYQRRRHSGTRASNRTSVELKHSALARGGFDEMTTSNRTSVELKHRAAAAQISQRIALLIEPVWN